MILPSEELLSEILDIEEGYIELARCDKDSTICYQYTRNANTEDESIEYHFVNIYELAHKVKEWALTQELVPNFPYIIYSSPYEKKVVGKTIMGHDIVEFYPSAWIYNLVGNKKEFHADTEPEAIFQAGELILKKHTK